MGTAVTLLGSADAFNSGGRGHSAYLVEDEKGSCAVDFGPTALMALRRLGKEVSALDSVLVTHLHGDHFAGIPFLLLDGIYGQRRERPLVVAGPEGIGERVQALCSASYRETFSEPLPFELRFIEWSAGQAIDLCGRRVLPLPVLHQDPPERSYGLRLQSGGATLAFTGDTGWCEELPLLADGADLLFAECTLGEPSAYDRHLGIDLLADRLQLLRARRIVFSHLGAAARSRGAELLALPTAPGMDVDLILGDDDLRVEG